MKRLITLFIIFSALTHIKAQNPFQSIGKEVPVLTLSNGQYKEFHPNDSLRQIGSVIVNIRTGKIHALLSTTTPSGEVGKERIVVSRWFSVDPLAHLTPSISPYAGFNNNPIYFKDPDGNTGEAGIYKVTDPEEAKRLGVSVGETIVLVQSNLIFYGTEAKNVNLHNVTSNIEKKWNDANGTTQIKDDNGNIVEYKVRFKVEAIEDNVNTDDDGMKKVIEGNTSFRNNYVRVEKNKTVGINKSSFSLGYNSGAFLTKDDIEKSNTGPHEWGHGLGLKHVFGEIEGKIRIMTPTGTNNGVTVVDGQRQVTQSDIDQLNLGSLLQGKEVGENVNLGKGLLYGIRTKSGSYKSSESKPDPVE